MDLAILGTGNVGRTLGTAWLGAGHAVRLGSRTADNATASAWAGDHGPGASHATFADAVRDADVVVNATSGVVSLDVLGSCDPADLAGTILVDVANPLDFSAGFPPTLAVCNHDSLAESIQRAHPDLRVVKALNTMAAEVMVDPGGVPGAHVAMLCGNDDDAKGTVTGLLGDLGWPARRILDLGALDAARGMEMWLPLWLRLHGRIGHPRFNLTVVEASEAQTQS